ncbi:MAG: saccharopine dehydrogenase family protein, partial [Verrucomicrobiota bacterium]
RKCAQFPKIFGKIGRASRYRRKADENAEDLPFSSGVWVVDAEDARDVARVIRESGAGLVFNAALPVHNLPIMDACLEAGAHYIDTSAPDLDAGTYDLFPYQHQFAYEERFRRAGLTGMLSLGFDPGVTNVFVAWAVKHLYDELHAVDILDCNGGDHGHPFATNFNPVVNLMEITQPAIHRENGEWVYGKVLEERQDVDFQEIGVRPMYLIYHEELETLARRFPEIRRMRFWMHFSDQYLWHLKAVRNVGLVTMDQVRVGDVDVCPLDVLRAVLPEPASLGPRYRGKTNIGCYFQGRKDGRSISHYLYNVCDHEVCYAELKNQAISTTAGVPAVIGAKLLFDGVWKEAGVRAPEDWDPDPFMAAMADFGLPWQLVETPEMGADFGPAPASGSSVS